MNRSIILLFILLVLCAEKSGAQNYAISLPGGNGANSNVTLPPMNISALPITIELWYKPDASQNDYATLISSRTATGANSKIIGLQYDKNVDPSKLKGIWDSPSVESLSPEKPKPGLWNHVALVVSSNSKTIYINGVKFDYPAATFSVHDFSTVNTYLGWDNIYWRSDLPARTLKGLIDEVRVWRTARTEQELESNRFKKLNGSESGLVGYWNFDDQSTKATDASPNAYHGTITGGSYVASDLFADMEFISATTTQKNTIANVNSNNNVLLCLEIRTNNHSNPLKLTSLSLSTLGTTSTSDIKDIKIYYTGTDSVFSTGTEVAKTSGTLATQDFTLASGQTLKPGKNYFWVTCDIARLAGDGNTIDIACPQFTLSGKESKQYTPSPASPEGKLVISPTLFVNHAELHVEVVSGQAATTIEGANFASFQQNAITTYNNYQYVCFWNTVARVCLARKKLPFGKWETIEFKDHTISASRAADNHYSISMGICENDGTIHLAFDHHNDVLHYKKSLPGLANHPEKLNWTETSFGPKLNYLVEGSPVNNVTYPRFISKPNGDLLYECRLGWSGDGDDFLWEYNASTGRWTYIGEYLNGTSVNENAYINGLHYDSTGRLHVSWVWRQTPDAQTNHDICYGYSDDDGRTWYNAQGALAGTVNSKPMTLNSSGLKVWNVSTYRGLINQESQCVDSKGGIHILQSYIPEGMANSTNFWNSRTNNGILRHVYRDETGTWRNDPIGPSTRNRSEIAVDGNNNLYVVAPNYRIFFASAANKWLTWTEFDLSEGASAINEGLIDREALLNENVLSFVFAQNGNKIIVPNYLIENKAEGKGKGLSLLVSSDTQFQDTLFHKHDVLSITGSQVATDKEEVALRCEGIIETVYPEAYTLELNIAGCSSLKLYVNDSLMLQTEKIETETFLKIVLPTVPTHKQRLKMEGTFTRANFQTRLKWSSDSQERELIPLNRLYENTSKPELTLSNNAALLSFSASQGTLIPTFDPEVSEYSLLMPTGYAHTMVLSALPRHARATVNGTGNFDIKTGQDLAVIEVTAEDGVTKKIYKFHVVTDTGKESVNAGTVRVFPTLSSTGFHIYLPKGESKLEICNLTGKIVLKKRTRLLHEWIELPKAGMYFLVVENSGKRTIEKIIKSGKM